MLTQLHRSHPPSRMQSHPQGDVRLEQSDATDATCAVNPSAQRLSSTRKRLLGVDFAKGVLVLVMVLYHWMNYFVGFDSGAYKYLRFLTPSFIFLAGFLIAYVYQPRFNAGDNRIPVRLVWRGLKLLAIVLVLNATMQFAVAGHSIDPRWWQAPWERLWSYSTGSAPLSFSILVPIGYLLIASAGLLVVARRMPALLHVITGALIAISFWCEWARVPNGYLEIFSMGMLGVSAGYLPIEAIHRVVSHRMTVLAVYAAYLWALTVWNAIYLLQIVGVCLNLAILYAGAGIPPSGHGVSGLLIRLGEYSLFGYIAQIAILQILHRLAPALGESGGTPALLLLIALAATGLSVSILDWVRPRVPAINRIYTAVFA